MRRREGGGRGDEEEEEAGRENATEGNKTRIRKILGGGQAPTAASGTGDPHLVNVHGQKFDLYQPGLHPLIRIPRSQKERTGLLVTKIVRQSWNEEEG